MQQAGSLSWQIRQGTNHAVEMALYLRDALALSVATEPDIPLLYPSVPVAVPQGVDRAAVTAEWPDWWNSVLDWAGTDGVGEPAERPGYTLTRSGSMRLRRRPAIDAALAAFDEVPGRYFALAKRAQGHPRPEQLGLGRLVAAREHVLGRPAQPFRLVITELNVAGMVFHRRSGSHVLMSARFASDIPRRDAALREVIDTLA
jgi:hypothetical protein